MADIALFGVGIDGRQARRGGAEVEDAFNRVSRSASRSKDVVDKLKRTLKHVFVGIGFIASVRSITKSLIDFESGLVGVAKTTNFMAEETKAFGNEVIRISLKIPVATNELLGIAQAAGQVGVKGVKDIQAFTETIAKLGTATNLQGEEAATVLARILNVTGESMSMVSTLGSVLVALGNASAANEQEIAHVTNQVALATSVFHVSSAEAAALGAVYASMGVRAELAGSATGRAFRTIDDAIRNGGEKMQALEEITGRTGDEIERVFRENAVAGFQMFVEGLGRIISTGGDAASALDRMGLSGEEILKVLPTIAARSELLARSLKIVNDEVEAGTALDEEANRAFDTLGARFKVFGNTINAMKLRFLESNDTLSSFMDTVNNVMKILTGFSDTIDGGPTTSMKNLAFAVKAVGLTLVTLTAMTVTPWLLSVAKSTVLWAKGIWATNAAIRLTILMVLEFIAALSAAFASFEIGKTIYEQFKPVQVFLAKFFDWMEERWIDLIGSVRVLWVHLKNDILRMLSEIVNFFADWLHDVADVVEIFNRKWGLAMKRISQNLEPPFETLTKEEVTNKLHDIITEWTHDIDFAETVLEQTLKDIDADFAAHKPGFHLFDTFKRDLNEVLGKMGELRDKILGINTLNIPEIPDLEQPPGAQFNPAPGTGGGGGGDGGGGGGGGDGTGDGFDFNAESERNRLTGDLNSAFRNLIANVNNLREGLRGFVEDLIESFVIRPVTESFSQAIGTWIGPLLGIQQTATVAANINTSVLQLNTAALEANTLALGASASSNTGAALINTIETGIGATTGGARGRVFSFASGGVINRPTRFAMATGGTGLVGEGGREVAFAPLTRTPSGELAVKQVGSGSRTIIHAPITIVANNPNEFRNSESQISSRLQRLARRSFDEVRE